MKLERKIENQFCNSPKNCAAASSSSSLLNPKPRPPLDQPRSLSSRSLPRRNAMKEARRSNFDSSKKTKMKMKNKRQLADNNSHGRSSKDELNNEGERSQSEPDVAEDVDSPVDSGSDFEVSSESLYCELRIVLFLLCSTPLFFVLVVDRGSE